LKKQLRNIVILTLLGVIAVGAIALTGFWHPEAPSDTMKEFLPAITLPTVLAAGFLDGINPCAFTVLLLFITALLATIQIGQTDKKSVRLRIIGMGAIFIGAIFLTYLTLGVGLLKSMSIFTDQHLPARIGALLATLFGLWMLKDYFLPDMGLRLQAPGKVGSLARKAAKKATFPALLAGGFLIGLCTIPCSGAVYLGILSLLAAQPTTAIGYSYLVIYNLVFILPLIILLILASSRPTLNRLAHWNIHHKERVRLVLGGGVVVLGLLMLVVV
jgi:cytochrome c biogenesis protein CcdA